MYILNKFFVISTNNLQIDKRCTRRIREIAIGMRQSIYSFHIRKQLYYARSITFRADKYLLLRRSIL